MAFPLINPYQQFFDANGDPLVSGTIEFRAPADNSLIDSYPTADDADAQTNANSNPLTLSSTGAATNGLFLEDGVNYKVILKDSDGATVGTWDDVQCPTDVTQATVGAALYPRTAAEISAGVTPTNYQYTPDPVIDARRYGLAVDGVTDDSAAIQNAIDVLEAANKGGTIILPSGTCHIGTGLTIARNGIFIEGQGAGGNAVSNDQGTTLKYTGSGTGVTMGLSGGGRWNIGLRRLRVDVSAAGGAAIGVQLFALRHWVLDNVRVVTSEGAGTLTGQTGIKFDGEAAFCGWGQWLNTFVKGDFTTGIHTTGTGAPNGCNASTFVGGGAFSTTSSIIAGGRGLYVERGNGNAFNGLDFTDWDIDIDCDGSTNFFQVRHETSASTYYLQMSGDNNTYVSMSHTAAKVNNTGSNNTLLLSTGFRNLQVQSGEATEMLTIRTTATDGTATLLFRNDARQWSTRVEGSNDRFIVRDETEAKNALQFDVAGAAAGETAMFLYDKNTDSAVRVSVGANDSGGSGYKVLRIPN